MDGIRTLACKKPKFITEFAHTRASLRGRIFALEVDKKGGRGGGGVLKFLYCLYNYKDLTIRSPIALC